MILIKELQSSLEAKTVEVETLRNLLTAQTVTVKCLEFAYHAKSSTTMCTLTVTSVVEHFNRNGTVVYGVAMDMSKAFDMVEWGNYLKRC